MEIIETPRTTSETPSNFVNSQLQRAKSQGPAAEVAVPWFKKTWFCIFFEGQTLRIFGSTTPKWCVFCGNKPPIREWFIPPIKMVIWGMVCYCFTITLDQIR